MDGLFFLIRLPFFLAALVLCLAFDIIRFPLIIAFHVLWVVWIVSTRLLGFPLRLVDAAWKNDSKLLTSGLQAKFDEVSRNWDSIFSDYFGSLAHLIKWQLHGSK